MQKIYITLFFYYQVARKHYAISVIINRNKLFIGQSVLLYAYMRRSFFQRVVHAHPSLEM